MSVGQCLPVQNVNGLCPSRRSKGKCWTLTNTSAKITRPPHGRGDAGKFGRVNSPTRTKVDSSRVIRLVGMYIAEAVCKHGGHGGRKIDSYYGRNVPQMAHSCVTDGCSCALKTDQRDTCDCTSDVNGIPAGATRFLHRWEILTYVTMDTG